MAKKVKFTILVLMLCFAKTSIYAGVTTGIPIDSALLNQSCNAPAPDSFHVTSRGGNFIAVAWNPAWAHAIHQLTVFIKSDSAGWLLVGNYEGIPGSSYLVNGVPFDKDCKLIIRTCCPSGEPGEGYSELDNNKTLVDLTVVGRMPLKPTIYGECQLIQYEDPGIDWVGFRVTYTDEETTISGLFEFEFFGPVTQTGSANRCRIKRVNPQIPLDKEFPILATDKAKIWPTENHPIVQSPNPFYMYHDLGGEELNTIGRIELIHSPGASPSVEFCISDLLPFWDYSHYTLETLVAQAAIATPFGPSTNNDRSNTETSTEQFFINNPFGDFLDINCSETSNKGNIFNVTMIDLRGRIIFRENFECVLNHLSIPTGAIAPGFYLVQIEREGVLHTIKAIKP